MKNLLFSLMLLFAPLALSAQETLSADSVQAVAPKHIQFEGVEMAGDIFEFSKRLQEAGFKLERRDANNRNYVFKGNVCGISTVFKVNFTRKTRTVYRIMVQMKNIPLDVLLNELNERYGEPYDVNERGYQWQLPMGAAMLGTPQGYDPTLVVMDAEGVARYKEEDM